MSLRLASSHLGWLAMLTLCLPALGCHALTGADPPAAKSDRGQQLWEEGQKALDAGDPEGAITLYKLSLLERQPPPRSHLSLAAAYMAKGEEQEACRQLGLFLDKTPDHRNARLYYAELLLKNGKHRDSFGQFERVAADLQLDTHPESKEIIHCHSRMLELAETEEDAYQAHLHRGIGLYWLAQSRAALDDPEGELPAEGLLCKAAGALKSAHNLRPGEARPCWYLHGVWRQLGQSGPAQRWLQLAGDHAPFSYLTAAEQRGLQLAASSAAVKVRP